MKKYLFILSLAGGMLAACSSGDDIAAIPELTQEEKDAAIIAEATADSDVEIRLGFGSQSNSSSVTRAPIESETGGQFATEDGKYLGIYCLAQKPQIATASPGPVAEGSIAWNSNDEDNLFYLMKRNQPAKVIKRNNGDRIGNIILTERTSDVVFLNPEDLEAQSPSEVQKHYYYPYGNWYNYYFYAYYPRQTENVTETATSVTVDMELNGTQDVIYAKAAPEDTPNAGYNAKYLRDKQDVFGHNELEDLPHLAMTHNLAQLRFYVKCQSPNYLAYGYGTEIGNAAPYKKLFKLKELKLTLVPHKWKLTVADRANTANEGKLTFNGVKDANNQVEEASSVTDIKVKTMSIAGDVVTSSNSDALATAVDIPYTGAIEGNWKVVVGEGDTYVWEATTDAATVDVNDPISALPTAGYLEAGNVGNVYHFKYDIDGDGNQDTSGDPLLVGYAMIPTTAMMQNLVIDNRGTNSHKPFISFTLEAGQTKDNTTNDPIAATEWSAKSQSIEIPTAGLEAGKVYNVILNIPVPEETNMWATLDKWVVVELNDTESGQNINMTVD